MSGETGALAAVFSLALILPAAADPSLADQRCQSLLERFSGPVQAKQTRAIDADGCEYEDVTISISPRFSYAASKVTIRRLDFADLEKSDIIPHSLRIEVTHLHMSFSGMGKVQSYIMKLKGQDEAITLDYDYVADKQRLDIRDVSVQGRTTGKFHLTASVDHVEPELFTKGGPKNPTDMKLESLRLHLENAGFVETLAIPLLTGLLQESDDPDGDVEKLKAKVRENVKSFLAVLHVGPDVGATIDAFLGDFPHPEKTFDLSLNFAPSLGALEAMAIYTAGGAAPSSASHGTVKASYVAASCTPAKP